MVLDEPKGLFIDAKRPVRQRPRCGLANLARSSEFGGVPGSDDRLFRPSQFVYQDDKSYYIARNKTTQS